MTTTVSAAPADQQPRSRGLGTVLVTGAASGLGRATARAVAIAGGQPLLLDRADPHAGAGPDLADAPSAVVDLADTRAAEEAVTALAERAGGLDAVVTAAGTDRCGRLADVPGEEWEAVVRVNLFGTAAVCRAALPFLTRSGGRIVTVASTLASRALPDASAYCASKFGVLGLSRALAAELQGEVGVTTLLPGGMNTAFFDGRDPQYQPGPDAMLNDPCAVADAVVFALTRPAGCEVRELVITPSVEPSWP